MPLDKEDIERLKEIFVTRQECNATTEEIHQQLTTYNVKLAVIETKLSQVAWLLRAVLSASLAQILAAVFNMLMGR